MAKPIVQQLKIDIAKIEGEFTRLTAILDALKTTLAYYEQDNDIQTVGQDAKKRPGSKLKDAIFSILVAAEQPLHYKEVYRQLKAKNMFIPGDNPARNVGAHLSGDERFMPVGNGRWTLKRETEEPDFVYPIVPSDTLEGSNADTRVPVESFLGREWGS